MILPALILLSAVRLAASECVYTDYQNELHNFLCYNLSFIELEDYLMQDVGTKDINLTVFNVDNIPLKYMQFHASLYEGVREMGFFHCGITLGENNFDQFQSLDTLTINGGNFSLFNGSYFSRMHTLRFLDLADNNIVVLDNICSSEMSIEHLLLGRNRIEKIIGNFRGCTELTYLDLSNNNLTHLASDALVGVDNLFILELQKNRLTQLNFTSKSLNVLNISYNLLTELNSNEFHKRFKSLSALDISHNSIEDIVLGTRHKTLTVKYLFLNNNKLKKLKSGNFENYVDLGVLDLSNNPLEVIEDGAFFGVKGLEYLILYNCTLKKLSPGMFSGMGVKIIDLTGSQVKEMLPETFSLVEKLAVVYLSGNRIERIVNGTFQKSTIAHLHLDNNNISVLEDDCFKTTAQNSTIEVLDLSTNVFKKISPGVFRGLNFLKTLDLSSNSLEDIEGVFNNTKSLEVLYLISALGRVEENLFEGLHKLTFLSLSDSKIREIPPLLFKPLRNLHVLDLSCNEIQEIPIGAFAYSTKISTLTLDSNPLTKLSPTIFKPLKDLRKLNISSTRITNYEEFIKDLQDLTYLILTNMSLETFLADSFAGLSRLTTLDVSRNKIRNITCPKSNTTSNLRILFLSNNLLGNVSKCAFAPFPHLKRLYLEENNLTDLETETFSSLTGLELLNVSYNNITEVNYKIFSNLSDLRVLDMQGNRIHNYDFRLGWYLKDLEYFGITLDYMKCQTVPYVIVYLKRNGIANNIFVDDKYVGDIRCVNDVEGSSGTLRIPVEATINSKAFPRDSSFFNIVLLNLFNNLTLKNVTDTHRRREVQYPLFSMPGNHSYFMDSLNRTEGGYRSKSALLNNLLTISVGVLCTIFVVCFGWKFFYRCVMYYYSLLRRHGNNSEVGEENKFYMDLLKNNQCTRRSVRESVRVGQNGVV